MGRLNTMTDNIATQTIVTAATYGPAKETLSIAENYFGAAGETRTYNVEVADQRQLWATIRSRCG